MCAPADSALAMDSTVVVGDYAVLSREVYGELVRFFTCEAYIREVLYLLIYSPP